MKKIFTFATAILLMSGAAFAHEGKTCGKGKTCCKKEGKKEMKKETKVVATASVKKA